MTDLETALNFVVRSIEKQAKAAGQPLSEDEHSRLENLPSAKVNYMVWYPELGPPPLVPRNINLERLCALAKAAYVNDRKINPESLDWEFAFTVFTLNHHPMWGVLNSAGVKKYSRPLWDQLFVIIAALLPLIAVLLLAWNKARTLLLWTGILSLTVAIVILIYFVSRQILKWKLENHIERCRLASRNIR